MNIVEVNLEYKLPTVEQARIRLDQALRTARSQNQQVLKLVHGYGSSGKGGAIKKDVASYLAELKEKNRIADFVSGEDFSPFNQATRALLTKVPSLSKDSDYSRGNMGVTIVLVY